MANGEFLGNQLLIAMPALGDPNFHRTVTIICEHSAEGALGIILNRPSGMSLDQILEQLSLKAVSPAIGDQPVLSGGPVQQERGFVLHEPAGEWDSTLEVSDEIRVTTSRDILSAMALGTGPRRAIVALGYAGWEAGQLEAEIRANAWLSAPASSEIVFELPFEQRWAAATNLLGIDPARLSGQAGHA
ncbi:MAG: YqgE/AlgH family protein [Gammaproteobacteria bacterium]